MNKFKLHKDFLKGMIIKMKKDAERTELETNISMWLFLQSLIVVGAAVIAFLFIQGMDGAFNGDGFKLHIGPALGMILPMCALIGGLNFYIAKAMLSQILVLSGAMQKAANGNFDAKLNTEGLSFFSNIFKNTYGYYNKMCGELKQVQILRSDFTNNFSHEFKTPIVSINGFAKLLLSGNISDGDRQQYLKIVADESARLADLANSTIALSKLDSQTIVTNKVPYALDEQLRHCAILLMSVWQEKNITIESEIPAVSYNGNEQLLEQVWLNLLSNAIKFTPADGEIKIGLSETDKSVIVSIADSGIGMSEDTAAHIFERHYQGDKSHASQGLGLGLSIVARIVELCEGEITVTSKKNEGSMFTVVLPK